MGVKILRSASICLSVPFHLKNHTSTLHKISVYVNCRYVSASRSSSDDNTIRYILPVLWITSQLLTLLWQRMHLSTSDAVEALHTVPFHSNHRRWMHLPPGGASWRQSVPFPTGLLPWCQEATSRAPLSSKARQQATSSWNDFTISTATVDVVLTRHTVANNYFKPTMVQSIAINTSVWLSCLSAHTSQKNTFKLHKISVRFFWSWLGPPLTTMQYVKYYQFCGWHPFT